MRPKKPDPRVSLLSGAIAGGIEAVAVWPTENIKTQLQLQGRASNPKFTTFSGGVRHIVATEGVLGLYTGLVPILLGALPKAGIRFGGNTFFKGKLNEMGLPMPKELVNFAGGVCAGVCEAVLAVTPMETVKTKTIQMNCGFTDGMRRILAEEGPAGLYKGVSATIMKQASNQGLRFLFFGSYKDWVTDKGVKQITPLQSLAGGMMAGCFSVLGNNPFDVVKTKMQGIDASKYKSTMDCFQHILKTEGVAGYYSGCIPRMYRVVPGQGIIFMSFESIQGTVANALGLQA